MQRHTDELQLLHALSLAVLAVDRTGAVTFANDASSGLFGRSTEDLVGRRVVDLVAGDADPDDTLPLALETVLDGTGWRGDLAVRQVDRESLVVAVSATPIRDNEGTVIGAIIGLEDMTDVRRAEAEAVESETRLRLAHAAAELGTWHWNALDGTTVWDDQMHHIYGLRPGEFDGTWDAWVASIHPESRTRAIAVVQQALDERSTYVLRHRIERPDGRPTWIEAHGKVLVDHDGNPAGTIGCVQDVTARIQMQQRQDDAAARALLLQQVTADFSEALTPDQVAYVHEASLERVKAIVGADQAVSEEDEQLLDTLLSQWEIAQARAELFRHTTSISQELQASLAASPLPTMDRFDIAAYYAPGGDELEQVGGDWYDAVATASGDLVVVVGDVMGRGVRAATTMIHVRAGIRGLLTVESSPAALLQAADQMLVRDAPEQFVTAAALRVEPDTGVLDICNAGHVPLLVLRPDGTATVVDEGSGAPLGVVPRLERTSQRITLEPGSIAVLVTDGVVESRDRDIDAGIERLRQRATELAHGSLEDLVDGLAALADDRLRDDVTVVAARLR